MNLTQNFGKTLKIMPLPAPDTGIVSNLEALAEAKDRGYDRPMRKTTMMKPTNPG